ncbi:spermidine/putrescine ABC transporter permease [Polycladomyces abyssicola]|uniref:Spermidine/putrescine ABC transporter permease n=1 Tax=Polycladomyces abyssicola TaxID=1125966 RepID=A0A8D5UGC1_9BACL|nr:ABC transporter permease [Polycladomyces abyssicola]BCU81445.1 spermidine/putrescine ABC transporter permease [Polycladomyces abyssicola]
MLNNATAVSVDKSKVRSVTPKRFWNPRLLILLIPPIIWLSVFLFVPYITLFINSFWKVDFGTIVHDFSFSNYTKFFTNELYYGTLIKTLKVAFWVTLFSVLLGYPLAYFINYKIKKNKQLMYTLVIIPLWVSYLVRAYAWKIVLGQDGILNSFLLAIGVIDKPLEIFLYSPYAVTLALTHIYTPWVLMSIYTSLEHIPQNLIEASKDLGAGRFRTFYKVVLPLSMPGVIAGATFAFVLTMGDFLAPQLLGGTSSMMISNVVYSLFGVANNWPLGSAIGIITLIIVIGILEMAHRLEKKTASFEGGTNK